jgi:hypothetical protein
MTSENKNWGEFSVLMLSGISIGLAGIFADGTTQRATSSQGCRPLLQGGRVARNAKTKPVNHTLLKNQEADGSVPPRDGIAVVTASSVAIGTGVSIILFAFTNKFNLLSTPRGRSIFMMIMASALVIIGSLSISIKNDLDAEPEDRAAAQGRLGGIILGFGLGLILVALPKLIISLVTKGRMTTDPVYLKKVNQLVTAGSACALSLFATIVGAWSWHINDKCLTSTQGGHYPQGAAPTINSIATVAASIFCVYTAIYFGFRAADSPIADILSNFKKMRAAGSSGVTRGTAAFGKK